MHEPSVAIAVAPRERFSATEQALETLYQHTPSPFTLIYVDGGSPKHIKRYLEAQSRQRGFRLIRTEYYLSPNQARNLAFREVRREVDSTYVVFIDNDVLVTPGWLNPLVACAEDTGAWLVGPLYYMGQPQAQVIHMAGGLAHIKEEQGKRRFFEKHRFTGRRLSEVRQDLRREPCELVEFHCMLVRTEALKRVGPLDERLLTDREHIDLCMTVHKAGGEVYLEPNAHVAWLAPPPIAWSDLPYFMLRWSEAWNLATARRFRDKWRLSQTDTDLIERCTWLRDYRHDVLRLPVSAIRRLLGWRLGTWVALSLEWMFLSLISLGHQRPPQRS
jgi:GT2 family glycosyltransferase